MRCPIDLRTQSRLKPGLHTLWLLLPQIDGFCGVGFEGECYFAARAGGLVSGENDFEDCAGIFAGNERLLVIFYTIDEVSHLLNETVVPNLFVDGERPTDC